MKTNVTKSYFTIILENLPFHHFLVSMYNRTELTSQSTETLQSLPNVRDSGGENLRVLFSSI